MFPLACQSRNGGHVVFLQLCHHEQVVNESKLFIIRHLRLR